MAAPAQTPPPVADFSTMSLEEVQAAVAPGEPQTMTTAGTTFDKVSKHLKDLSVDLNKAALDLAVRQAEIELGFATGWEER